MLTLDDLRGLIAEVAEIDVARVEPRSRLVADLGLDSLHLLHVMAGLAERGVEAPEDLLLEAETVEGIHQAYVNLTEPPKEMPQWNLGR